MQTSVFYLPSISSLEEMERGMAGCAAIPISACWPACATKVLPQPATAAA